MLVKSNLAAGRFARSHEPWFDAWSRCSAPQLLKEFVGAYELAHKNAQVSADSVQRAAEKPFVETPPVPDIHFWRLA
jgi:hypothetical protein